MSAICSCSKDDGAGKVAAPAVADPVVVVAPVAPVSAPAPDPLPIVDPVPAAPPSVLTWAEVIDLHPDPKIVTDFSVLLRLACHGEFATIKMELNSCSFLLEHS
ncbi:MAG: hypothetical protein NTY97_00045 [Planctomycetota bacterium]|nr:hypothetical protein [Planctomycetota bacterium]